MDGAKRSAEDDSAYLHFFNPQDRKERMLLINKRKYVIGRVNSCDITVVNIIISRKHCVIECDDHYVWTITDSSLSGTFVNRERLVKGVPHVLHNEDVISLAGEQKFPFTFLIGNQALRKRKRISVGTEDKYLFTQGQDICGMSVDNVICATNSEVTGNKSWFRSDAKDEAELIVSAQSDLLSDLPPDEKLLQQLEIASKELAYMKERHAKEMESCRLELQVVECRLQFNCETNDNLNAELLELRKSLIEKDQELLAAKTRLLEVEQKEVKEDTIRDQMTLKSREDLMDIIETELQCSICNEIAIEITCLKCSHMFCSYCIQKWMRKKKECAVCRSAVKGQVNARALDSFINIMLEKYSPELIAHRNQIILERNADNSKQDEERRRNRRSRHHHSPRLLVPAALIPEIARSRDRATLRPRGRIMIPRFPPRFHTPRDESVIEIRDSP